MEETSTVTCTECRKDFRHEFFLRKHKRTYRDTTPFTCDECRVEVLGKKALINHKRMHQKPLKKNNPTKEVPKATKAKTEQTFLCEECSKSFTRKQNLERHKMTHIEKETFKCNVCEKEFSRNDNLELHVKAAHAMKKKGNGLISSASFEKPQPNVD